MALEGHRGGELTNAEVHQEMNRGCKYAASWWQLLVSNQLLSFSVSQYQCRLITCSCIQGHSTFTQNQPNQHANAKISSDY